MLMIDRFKQLFHPQAPEQGGSPRATSEPLDRWQDYIEESKAYSLYLAGKDPRAPTLSFAQFIDRLDAARLAAARRSEQRRQEAG